MEERTLKVNFNKSGSGSYTPRIALPITELQELKEQIKQELLAEMKTEKSNQQHGKK